MANSPLVDYVKISPNKNSPRNNKIDKITIHHTAGNITIETLGKLFAQPGRQASSNYGIDSYGRVGLFVDESDRAWTSGNAENDNRAVTIEVSNDGGAPNWHVSDKALAKLIDLCVDICKRNGIERRNYTGDKNGNLTRHNMFQATACPGPYLQSKFPYIAEEVNRRLNAMLQKINPGDTVRIVGNTYTNGVAVPQYIKNQTHVVARVDGDRALLGYPSGICSWVSLNGLELVKSAVIEPPKYNEPAPEPPAPAKPPAVDKAIAKGIISASDNLNAYVSKQDVINMLDKLGLI